MDQRAHADGLECRHAAGTPAAGDAATPEDPAELDGYCGDAALSPCWCSSKRRYAAISMPRSGNCIATA